VVNTLESAVAAITACGLSYFAAAQIVSRASARLVDHPNARSSHATPIPRGGGVGIALSAVFVWAIAGLQQHSVLPLAEAALIGIVAALGFWDDISSLSVARRLLAQATVCAATIGLWGHFTEIEAPHLSLQLGRAPGCALTFIWLMGLTNAYNFMDGIDGIASVQALAAGLTWSFCARQLSTDVVALIAATCVGATAGFLPRNWSPAKVFLGDVGSTALGYQFAVIPLVAFTQTTGEVKARIPLSGLACVWPFVFDSAFTLTRRAVRGAPVWRAHREHLYQRLVDMGYAHWKVSALYALFASGSGLVASIWLLAGQTRTSTVALALLFGTSVALPAAVTGLERARGRRLRLTDSR